MMNYKLSDYCIEHRCGAHPSGCADPIFNHCTGLIFCPTDSVGQTLKEPSKSSTPLGQGREREKALGDPLFRGVPEGVSREVREADPREVREADPREVREADPTNNVIEHIAITHAMAYEIARGAVVINVSTFDKARAVGLSSYPGIDLLSRHPKGERFIEVKGKARMTGDVQISNNELIAFNKYKEKCYLYVICNCLTQSPKIIIVKNPSKLKSSGVDIKMVEILRKAKSF